MLEYLIRRLASLAPTLVLVSMLIFGLQQLLPGDPAQILAGEDQNPELIAQLREHFDLIILDCAPVLPIAETRDIVALADNVIVVTRWRYTTDRVVRAALKKLPLQALGDLGVVLNRVDLRKKLRFGDGDPEIFAKSYKNYYPKTPQ